MPPPADGAHLASKSRRYVHCIWIGADLAAATYSCGRGRRKHRPHKYPDSSPSTRQVHEDPPSILTSRRGPRNPSTPPQLRRNSQKRRHQATSTKSSSGRKKESRDEVRTPTTLRARLRGRGKNRGKGLERSHRQKGDTQHTNIDTGASVPPAGERVWPPRRRRSSRSLIDRTPEGQHQDVMHVYITKYTHPPSPQDVRPGVGAKLPGEGWVMDQEEKNARDPQSLLSHDSIPRARTRASLLNRQDLRDHQHPGTVLGLRSTCNRFRTQGLVLKGARERVDLGGR
ncbi:hypothetical protein LA080_009901 [Diaporthe eres]|nr:hypothetical protein LA080_009901 [Diaporthe eres]